MPLLLDKAITALGSSNAGIWRASLGYGVRPWEFKHRLAWEAAR